MKKLTKKHIAQEDQYSQIDQYQTYSDVTKQFALRAVWKHLCGKAREKGYKVSCGHYEGQFSILGHRDWPGTWFANYSGVLHAVYWLEQQGPALSEDERIEKRSAYWEERKAIEADYIQREW